jgi:exopolyphosphatase/guanosine-5'-triphosphate,3'-diphosphate pyrophosphatase
MGGGSVELTVARDGVALGCETLRLGPVRLLTRLRAENRSEIDAEAMLTRYRGVFRSLVDSALDTPPTLCIGTGGNIERMAKLRVQLLGKTKFGKIKLEDLDPIIDHVLAMSIPMRIERLELRPDRADVIGIALLVLRMVLRDAGVTRLLVPGVGLKEGLLQQVARSASALRT